MSLCWDNPLEMITIITAKGGCTEAAKPRSAAFSVIWSFFRQIILQAKPQHPLPTLCQSLPHNFSSFLLLVYLILKVPESFLKTFFFWMEFLSGLQWGSLELPLLLWLHIFPSVKSLPGCPQTYPIHPSIHHYASEYQLKEEKGAGLHLLLEGKSLGPTVKNKRLDKGKFGLSQQGDYVLNPEKDPYV